MGSNKSEGGEYWPYPPPEKRAGRIPAHQSESIVTPSGCLRQGDFRAGQAISLAEASGLSPVPWADLGAWFCGGLFRWVCPGAFSAALSMSGLSLILRLRPRGYWPRFQASIATILTSLTHRLTFHHWPSFLSRQRQGHWLRSLIRKVRWHLGVGWEGNLLSAFQVLWDQGIVPVSRVI